MREALEQTIDKLEWRSQAKAKAKAKAPILYLDEFGSSSVNYSVCVWIDDANDTPGRKSELHEVIWRALKDNGITIAYPQMDLHLDRDVIKAIAKE